MHIFNMLVTYLQSIDMETLPVVREVNFTKYALLPFIQYMALVEHCLSSKCCKFVKIHFFSMLLLHAHIHYACNIPA